MKKDIRDYLHFYLGCKVARKHTDSETGDFYEYARLRGCSDSEVQDGKIVAVIDAGLDHWHEWYVEETIPILRPLSDISEKEKLETFEHLYGGDQFNALRLDFKIQTNNLNSEAFAYLLSKGFDLFGLIEAGLAIDKTTLKQTA